MSQTDTQAEANGDVYIPSFREMLWETLEAFRALGGSGHVSEIAQKAIEIGRYSEEQQAALMPNGRKPRLRFKVQWCLTALKAVGYLDNSGKGVWALTDAGQRLEETDIPRVREQINAHYRALSKQRKRQRNDSTVAQDHPYEEPEEPHGSSESLDTEWKDDLLSRMKAIHPSAFERLCQRLLREAGFEKVQVTGKAGDGGIDGVGLVRLGLLSFPTYFQCKRYDGTVGAAAIRDFRGAMAGRGEKGVIITTSTFTAAAQQEATRDGVPPIDLLDGDMLCDLLKRHGVGVRVAERTVEDVTVDGTWWDEQV